MQAGSYDKELTAKVTAAYGLSGQVTHRSCVAVVLCFQLNSHKYCLSSAYFPQSIPLCIHPPDVRPLVSPRVKNEPFVTLLYHSGSWYSFYHLYLPAYVPAA